MAAIVASSTTPSTACVQSSRCSLATRTPCSMSYHFNRSTKTKAAAPRRGHRSQSAAPWCPRRCSRIASFTSRRSRCATPSYATTLSVATLITHALASRRCARALRATRPCPTSRQRCPASTPRSQRRTAPSTCGRQSRARGSDLAQRRRNGRRRRIETPRWCERQGVGTRRPRVRRRERADLARQRCLQRRGVKPRGLLAQRCGQPPF